MASTKRVGSDLSIDGGRLLQVLAEMFTSMTIEAGKVCPRLEVLCDESFDHDGAGLTKRCHVEVDE